MDELKNCKPIQNKAPKETEKFADLLDIAVINQKEAKREDELDNGNFIARYYTNYERGWWLNTIVGYSNTRQIEM